jgi:hypothetical protein
MRLARKWILALFATLLVALSSGALSGSHYFCRMAGRVVTSCCCGKAAHAAAPRAATAVRAADCCERLEASSLPQVSQRAAALDEVAPAAVVAVLVEVPRVPPAPLAELHAAHPGRGPPRAARLFALHSAWLI